MVCTKYSRRHQSIFFNVVSEIRLRVAIRFFLWNAQLFFGIVALCTFFYSNQIFGHFCCNIHFFPNDSSGWKFNRCNDCFDIAKNSILYWRLSLYCVAFQLKWHVNGMSFVTIKSSKKGTGKEVPSILCKY